MLLWDYRYRRDPQLWPAPDSRIEKRPRPKFYGRGEDGRTDTELNEYLCHTFITSKVIWFTNDDEVHQTKLHLFLFRVHERLMLQWKAVWQMGPSLSLRRVILATNALFFHFPASRAWSVSYSSSPLPPFRMPDNEWTVCPKCHGEGKIRKPPSRKVRLRHKRSKTEAPPRLDPCQNCNQTGLVVAASDVPSPLESPLQVAIIGGGLGGLALGVALMHRNIPFQIFERDSDFSQRSQGYGLTMQQASRALAAFGIPYLPDGITSTKHVVHTIDGSIVGEWGIRKWGRDANKAPPKRQNVHIARQALRRQLLDALGQERESRISWGHKLVALHNKEGEGCVELEFQVGKDDKRYTKANLVIGADGIRSTVREYCLLGEQTTPLRYLKCLVVLGICPLSILESDSRQDRLLDGETVFQTADGNTRIYLMPYSNTEYMWQLSFPMESEESAKALSRRGPAALKKEALARCKTWHTPIPDVLQKTPVDLVSGYPVYDRDLIKSENFDKTMPISLLGDAAHPMSPFKGQGANQALLDALSLARSLYSTCSLSNSSTFEAIIKYQDEMIVRSAKKVKASAQAAEFLHTEAATQEGNITRGAAAAIRLNKKSSS